jgi:predicted membrane protein
MATGFGNSRLLRETTCLEEGKKMLWTIVVILLVLWLLGMVSSYTMSGLIHILLVVALIMVLIRVIQGRRIV